MDIIKSVESDLARNFEIHYIGETAGPGSAHLAGPASSICHPITEVKQPWSGYAHRWVTIQWKDAIHGKPSEAKIQKEVTVASDEIAKTTPQMFLISKHLISTVCNCKG